jgi:hypothetical protein
MLLLLFQDILLGAVGFRELAFFFFRGLVLPINYVATMLQDGGVDE